MSKMIVMLGVVSVIALPSCMHPVDNVLHARAESKARLLEAQGHVSQGACDDVGQYAAQSASRGLTLEIATASAQGLR